jgi:hypothetical protein
VPAISANGRSNRFIGILCSPPLYDFVNRAYVKRRFVFEMASLPAEDPFRYPLT